MTTEPKFVPDESVRITVGDGTALNVKLIDCVGYMVDGALGAEEEGAARMVMTPWSEAAMPFTEAAELGTSKVIGEHSTIGMLVTTDGTIGEIPRENYIPAEERVADELCSLGKPFAIVLNSRFPDSDEARALAESLEEKYGVPVALVSCPELSMEDIREILGLVLGEFPLRSLTFTLPSWCEALPEEHPVRAGLYDKIECFVEDCERFGDVIRASEKFPEVILTSLDAGVGTGELSIPLSEEVYYETLSELTGLDIKDESALFSTMTDLAKIKERYEKIECALADAEDKGYGIVMPSTEELTLEEPRTVKEASGWGVSVTARANSIHMIKTEIRTEVSPVVGTEEQAEEVARYLQGELEENPEGIWECNMFGKSLRDLVSDGMSAKMAHMPMPSREKLGETLEKIINEGSNGLICILL